MQGYYYEEHYRELYDNEKPLQLVLFWAKNGLMKRLSDLFKICPLQNFYGLWLTSR